MATEIEEESRTLQYVRKGFYVGRRCFGATTGSGIGDALALIGADFPGMPTGEEAPKGARFQIVRHPSGKKKFDLIRVEYRTSMIGKGLIYIDEDVHKERLVYDTNIAPAPNNAIIEGPETRELGGRQDLYEWMVTKGSNIVGRSYYSMQVVTAYTAAQVPAVVQKMMALNGRSINEKALTEFISVAKQKLLWRGSKRRYDRADEYTFVYRMAYNKDGWTAACESTPGVWGIRQEAVLDVAGAPLVPAETREISGFHAGFEKNAAGAVVAASAVAHNLYVDGDFTFLDNLTMVV